MYEMREEDEGGRGIKCEYSSQRSGERERGEEEEGSVWHRVSAVDVFSSENGGKPERRATL